MACIIDRSRKDFLADGRENFNSYFFIIAGDFEQTTCWIWINSYVYASGNIINASQSRGRDEAVVNILLSVQSIYPGKMDTGIVRYHIEIITHLLLVRISGMRIKSVG